MDMLNIGQIVNTHGIKGEVKVFPLTDNMERFKKLKTIYIDGAERKIEGIKFQAKVVLLKIEGIESPEEGEKYKLKYIQIDRKNAVKLEKDRYFITDIEDSIVVDTNGVEIGKVTKVMSLPSNDVYEVMGEKEILIPALKSIIKDIDIVAKKITITPIGEWYED